MTQVSIIIPCYNEEKTIYKLLAALYAQDYPRQQLEVVIADGLSTDNTHAEIERFQAAHPDLAVQVIVNHAQIIPAALNAAIAAAHGEVIVRLDAHSVPYPDYVARSVAGVLSGQGKNVGGVWEIQAGAMTWIGRAIAAAAAHPFGVGDAKYRYTDQPAAVDTVPFGAFYRSLIDEVGGYDERLLANEDYEFNTRIRQAGGTIWLDPQIRTVYFARPTLRALAKQYWRYGFWKVHMLRRYPDTLRWRQALPPVLVLSLLGLAAAALWLVAARWLLGLEVVLYALVLLIAGWQTMTREKYFAHLLGVPLAIATMHLCWGSAFLWSLLSGVVRHSEDA